MNIIISQIKTHLQITAYTKYKVKQKSTNSYKITIKNAWHDILLNFILFFLINLATKIGVGVCSSGKTQQLLYDSHTYYRIGVTEKWVCTEQKCYKDGSHSTDTLIFLIRKTSP